MAERSGTLRLTNDDVNAELGRQSREGSRAERPTRGESSRVDVRESARETNSEARGADTGNRTIRNGVVPKPESIGTVPNSERGESRRVVRADGGKPSSAEVVTESRPTREAAPESVPAPRRMTVPRETPSQDRPVVESPRETKPDTPPADTTRDIEQPVATRTREAAPEVDPAPRRVTAPRESRRADAVSESPRVSRIGNEPSSRPVESAPEVRNPSPHSSSRLAESPRPVQTRNEEPAVRVIPRRDPVRQESPVSSPSFDAPQPSPRVERPEAPARPEIDRRDTRPEISRPEIRRPEVERPEVRGPEIHRQEIPRAQVERPQVERPQVNAPSSPRAVERPVSPREGSSRFPGRP